MQKILIIDDDTRNIFALEATLKAKGYSCVTATTAEEGISRLESDPGIGVVLMDMMMPETDGYTAIAALREHPRLSSIPVIAVTAQAMAGDRERVLEAGADAYVSKPVDVDQLLGYLGTYIKKG